MNSVSTFKNDKQGKSGNKCVRWIEKNLHSEKGMIKNTRNLKNKMTQEKPVSFSLKNKDPGKAFSMIKRETKNLLLINLKSQTKQVIWHTHIQQQQQDKPDLNAGLENLTSWLSLQISYSQDKLWTELLEPATPSDKHSPRNSPASGASQAPSQWSRISHDTTWQLIIKLIQEQWNTTVEEEIGSTHIQNDSKEGATVKKVGDIKIKK